jgi:uncharacterized membrane protein YeaQ/YmgE (transglycosylase-associated protein family)
MFDGPFYFGLVIGFVTYRTLRHKTSSGVSDIAAVIGAVGGGAVLNLFPAGSMAFDHYASGLALGFFCYLALSILIGLIATKASGSTTKGAKVANEFLGD